MFLTIAPIPIIGVIAVGKRLVEYEDSLDIQVGKVFGIIAFAIFEMMMVVQQGTRIYFGENLLAKAPDESSKEILQMVYKGVNSIQFNLRWT